MTQTGSIYERAQRAAQFIQQQTTLPTPDFAVVLGSGLGAFADQLKAAVTLPYQEIPGFARSTVEGHSGQLVIGKLSDAAGAVTVAAMQGRFHYYEGYELSEVTFPIRVFHCLGIQRLVLTNAAGGVNPAFKPGSLMLLRDHINLMTANPLRGPHESQWGARFPDMTDAYCSQWRDLARHCANDLQVPLHEGVYLAFSGPNYETPAEVRMAGFLGGDVVGMSTVPETIVARQMGMKVLGISLITNAAAGVSAEPINHAEVMEMGRAVSAQFIALLNELLRRTAQQERAALAKTPQAAEAERAA